MEPEQITDGLLEQRVRNRLMEYWELASSEEAQKEYQKRAPINLSNELINRWEDWVNSESPLRNRHKPAYTDEELAQVVAFNSAWLWVCDNTPASMPPFEEFVGTDPWKCLKTAAEKALRIFKERGYLDEDREL